jgi:hypothetical protein
MSLPMSIMGKRASGATWQSRRDAGAIFKAAEYSYEIAALSLAMTYFLMISQWCGGNRPQAKYQL